MFAANLGDLAQNVLLRRQINDSNVALNQLTEELGSGIASDLQTHLRGEFTPLTGITRSLELNQTYADSNALATQFAASQQIALSTVQDMMVAAATDFIQQSTVGTPPSITATVLGAEAQFEQVVTALNTSYAGRSLFSGTATQTAPLIGPEEMLVRLEAEAVAAGVTSGNDLAAVMDAWFDTPGGGFDTEFYQGSVTGLAPFDIAEGAEVELTTRADNAALRDTMKAFATVALIGRGVLGDDMAAQRQAFSIAGDTLINTIDEVVVLQSGIGFTEQLIEEAKIRTEAETTVLVEAREALIGVDEYETAVRLNEVQVQVETLYTITQRLSRLTLANFLR